MDQTQTQFSNLPPPPQGQTGINPNQFSHLPPPPKGQQGLTFEQMNAQAQIKTPQLNRITGNPEITTNDIFNKPIQDAFSSGVNQTKQGFQEAQNATNPGQLLEGGLATAAGAANTVLSPFAPITAPIGKAINWLGDKIGNIPAVQRFAMSKTGQNVARGAQDVANVTTVGGALTGLKGGAEVAPQVADTAVQGVKALDTKLGNIAPTPEQSFQSNVNKAFPVLKKDVGKTDAKVNNVHTAFSDIVQNKDSIGLVDKSGAPRNPQNFTETVDAQNTRLPQIYKDYTSKLQGVDKQTFDQTIHNDLINHMQNIDEKLTKENSVDNRRALVKIKNEIGSLRDPSPEGIQNYIQTINQKIKPLAPGGALTPEQIQYANLGGDLRKTLDNAVTKSGGEGYQDLRNTYAAHKAIQSQLLMAAKKEMNKTPGFTEKLANLGLTAEGVNFLVTHNPQALLMGGAIKGATMFGKWLSSPQRALQNIFGKIEKGYTIPKPSSPQTINAKAITQPIKSNIN